MVIKIDGNKIEINDFHLTEIIKDSVCEYFNISRGTLGDPTRAVESSYPRKVFWYFARRQYLIRLDMLQEIAGNEYTHGAVIIQSETMKLQILNQPSKRFDVDEIQKIINDKVLKL